MSYPAIFAIKSYPPMKRTVLCAIAAAMLCASCNKAVDAIVKKAEASASSTVDVNGFTSYTIQNGNHYADGNSHKSINLQQQSFLVKFDSSAIYQTRSAENQYDINKLWGFSDNGGAHHEYSARIGWRWSDGALRLFAYVYNSGIVASKEISAVAIGKEVRCSINATLTAYLFTVDGTSVSMPRTSKTATINGYQLYPYFGGDEVAPHAITIRIKVL